MQAQHIFKGIIKDSVSNEIFSGVSAIVKSTGKGTTSSELGEITITGISSGKQTIVLSYAGHENREFELFFPVAVFNYGFKIRL